MTRREYVRRLTKLYETISKVEESLDKNLADDIYNQGEDIIYGLLDAMDINTNREKAHEKWSKARDEFDDLFDEIYEVLEAIKKLDGILKDLEREINKHKIKN